MPHFSFLPHNRTGDAWFSVLGCLLPAVASMFLSLVAIRQTRNLNLLDKKMHRPALAFQSAKLTVWYLKPESYEACSFYRSMSAQQQGIVRDYRKKQINEPYYCLLKIDLDMLLKNEISIEKIEISSFKFIIYGKEYSFVRNFKKEDNTHKLKKFESLEHKFENGIETYSLQWILIAFVPEKKNVWRELYNAIKNEEFLNPRYEEFWSEIEMKIKFGLNEEREESLKAKIYFCSEEGYSEEEDTVYCVLSKNGRLGYY